MRVYTGRLVGGPDHDDSVSVSVPRIKTETTTHLWLDGEDKPSSVITHVGSYYWIESLGIFRWHAESMEIDTNRMLKAA